MANPLLSPKQAARFRVTVPGSGRVNSISSPIVTLFQSAGPLSIRIRKGTHRHGGSPVDFTYPEGVEHAEITLTAGSINDLALFNWAAEAAAAAAGIGSAAQDYLREITIDELGRSTGVRGAGVIFGDTLPGGEIEILNTYRLVDCWPTEYVAGEYNNNTNSYLIQRLTLQYHALRVVHSELKDEAADTRFLVDRLP